MLQIAMASLPAKLTEIRALIDQDRKKAGLLAVLTLAFIFIMIRTFGGGNFTAETAAAILPSAPAPKQDAQSVKHTVGTLGSPAVRAWIDGPLPPLTRNLFVVDLTRFSAVSNAPTAVEQVNEVPLDAIDRAGDAGKLKVDRARSAAQTLKLQQIWVSVDPRHCSAVVNGRLLRPGQTIDSFRLISVTRNSIVLEREGVEVTLKMPTR